MMKKRYTILLSVLIVLVILLIPLIFNKKEYRGLEAPSLADVNHSEVFFKNQEEQLNLAGMLMIPEGEGPYPTVVIIQGSGPSFRGNGWYLSVIKHLQDNNIAVLIPDKRGCEKSEGQWIGANFDQLANDALSAIEFIKIQEQFEPSYIGLVGMSQGGWIAPVAATKSDDVSFFASISGASVSVEEQLLHEEIHNISEYTYPLLARLIAPISTSKLKQMDHLSAYSDFDPITYLKELEIPVMFAFGEGDKNVPVNACIDRLKENNLNHFSIKTYPDGGHVIVDDESARVSARFLNDLALFIKEVENE